MDSVKPSASAARIVAVAELRHGMFVADLDRPWLGTPFLLQGFLIEDDEQIAHLRDLCSFVRIDPARSIGMSFTPPERGSRSPRVRRHLPAFVQEDVQRGRLDFMAFLRRLLRRGKGDVDDIQVELLAAGREARALAADGVDVPLELEMLAGAPAYDGAERAVAQVLSDIRTRSAVDLYQAEVAVHDMVCSVMRNPDALMWIARLRTGNEKAYQRALDTSVHMMVFGNSMGMREAELELLGLAGLVLDIGCLHLPAALQDKTGGLSPDEHAEYQKHVGYSIEILNECSQTKPELIAVVRRHHERIDGSGYPDGLHGDAIGLYGEMAGVVDSYCAMVRQRSHAQAISSQQALEILLKERDVRFSANVLDQFVQCVGLYPVGALVELHTGEVGVVVAQNRVRRLQPRIMVLLQADKQALSYPLMLDLLYEPKAPDGSVYRILRGLPPDAYGIDPQEFYLG
ncbi:MAG: metal dependent phosphohydrolase [Proteobacteria bacterium]|nr:metal dependent phosphohydrolase [Pseudomonadota bacterium]